MSHLTDVRKYFIERSDIILIQESHGYTLQHGDDGNKISKIHWDITPKNGIYTAEGLNEFQDRINDELKGKATLYQNYGDHFLIMGNLFF